MKAKTLVFGAVGLAAVVALGAYGFRPQPVPVDLAEITRGPMQITINADGVTRIRDVYELAAPISGTAERSPVAVGDPVVSGETVVATVRPVEPALLDTRSRVQAEAAVREAEAALRVADAQLSQAKEDLTYTEAQTDRTRKLVERGIASLTALEEVDQMRRVKVAAVYAAQSAQAMAQSSLARASAALIEPSPENGAGDDGSCCISLHAPVDGVVLDIASISERPVQAGAPLLSIGQRDNLEIVADLLSSDSVRIGPDALASVERWGGDTPLQAQVRRIEPSARTKVSALGIEEQRVDVLFDLLSPPEDRPGLGHGFAVYLRIVEWQADDVLRLPLSAAFRVEGDWHVFVVEDGLARQVPVTLGRRNGQVAEVLDGLTPGAMVITHPSDRVEDGIQIADRAAM